ncbi:hypothetical protein ABPG75_007769 [Micractinium tetrahymenae]
MPVTPESRQSRRDVKASIAAQFWEQPVHSSKSLDGQLWALPAEPPALSLTGSSGLSRTQQLIAAQAVRIPFVPSYDGSADGAVLDRVLARAGGQRWWAALSGRVKAQRMYIQANAGEAKKLDAVRDLSNYSLCARGRFQLGRRLTLNGVVEAPDADRLQRRLAQRLSERRQAASAASTAAAAAAPGSAAPAGDGAAEATAEAAAAAAGAAGTGGADGSSANGPAPAAAAAVTPAGPTELEPYTAHATLRCALPGHDLSATAGYNLSYLDSTGDAAHVPLAVSLDLSNHDRQDGLQYRVGLHQVTAPLTEMPSRPGSQQKWRSSLHAQGALAVEGEAWIWRGGSGGKEGGKDAAKEGGKEGGGGSASGGAALAGQAAEPAAAKQQQAGAGGSEEGGGGAGVAAEEPRKSKLARALDSAAAAEEDPVIPRKQGGGHKRGKGGEAASAGAPEGLEGGAAGQPAEPAAAGSATDASTGGQAASAAAGSSGAAGDTQLSATTLEQFMRPLEHLGEQMSDMLHHVTHPGAQQQGQQAAGGEQREACQQQEAQPPQVASSTGREPPSSSTSSSSSLGSPPLLLGLSSQSITAAIQDSAVLLKQVKESVERLTSNVQDGSLQRLSQQLADSRAAPPRRRPYSMLLAQVRRAGRTVWCAVCVRHSRCGAGDVRGWVALAALPGKYKGTLQCRTCLPACLAWPAAEEHPKPGGASLLGLLAKPLSRHYACCQLTARHACMLGMPATPSRPLQALCPAPAPQPHLKLNAALGCLARMPLPALRSCSFPHASLDLLDQPAAGGGASRSLPLGAPGARGRHASSSSLVSRASHSSHLAEAWQPYLKGTALRVFASAGVSGQLGRFSRPFLDYTAASARVDVGLTSPHVVGVMPDASTLAAAAADGGHRPDKHRAFALEGRGAWHALSVSLAQQLVGPVRARLDARFALDPTSMPASEGERSTLKGVLQTALSVRPSLLEAVYGLDCVLPGTEGAARLAIWVSPKRREVMAELRLF